MFKRSILKIILPLFILFVLFFNYAGFVLAQDIWVTDKGHIVVSEEGNIENQTNWMKDALMWFGQFSWERAGSVAFWMAVRSALNQIAYDTANWLGSGGKGQKPMFITEGWGEYLANIADNAAGVFLEHFTQELDWGDFDFCNPSASVKIKIGLGLVDAYRPIKAKCTFSKMKENWAAAIQSGNFLNNLQSVFDPTEGTLVQALTVQTSFWGTIDLKEKLGTLGRIETKGWLDITNLSGDRESPPGYALSRMEQAQRIREQTFSANTKDAFTDAINIFLNQLAIALFNNLLASLGGSNATSKYNWPNSDYVETGGLSDYYTDFDSGGLAAAKLRFNKLVEPNFKKKGDYDILAELATCPNPNKAGPTNCVISEEFKSAIENNMTVGEAMRAGYLDPNGIFGFNANGLEPLYNEGYPYRSMVILRKFRILPVGWELAAQYIKENQIEEPTGSGGARNLEYMVNCFDPTDDYGDSNASYWCQGYVDPDWVLLAPFNYCERSGPGPEILYETVAGSGDDSRKVISRNDNYCADEKTCIKEDDGICRLYGYCTEEKRVWDFDSNSCEPEYNTCQAFQTYNGKTVAYLENTLDHGVCNISNVGCREYCQEYNYSDSKYDCTSTAGDKVFLDRDAEKCSKSENGCSEFIRTKPIAQSNLFYDSGFETVFGWSSLPIVNQICDDGDVIDGLCSLNLTADIAPVTVPIFIGENKSMEGEAFTFSVYAKNCGDTGKIIIGGDMDWAANNSSTTLATEDTWRRFSVSHVMIPATKEILIGIEGITNNGNCSTNDCCRIDGVKVERGGDATAYKSYDGNDKVYMKILPDYLEKECYMGSGDYNLVDDHPEICEEYNRKCNESEWGCELYTSKKSKLSVPAIVKAADYCPKECVGYNEYMQLESSFESQSLQYFIPENARKCSAGNEGCTEFTNLDTIEEGGENREYYIRLKRCIRPNDPSANCSEFYTWEGSSETGFQLKIHVLQVDEDFDDVANVDGLYSGDPDVVEGDQLVCNQIIYSLPATDPGYNEDCLEFYNVLGEVSYHQLGDTLSCTENCHPYRKTDNNVVRDLVTNNHLNQAQCEFLSKYPGDWRDISRSLYLDPTSANDQCVFCKAQGVWNEEHGKCIYMAIPNEGKKCQNSQSGCREYSGSEGNTTQIALNDDFEGSLNDWQGLGASTVVVDSESLLVGGESLKVIGGSMTKDVNAWSNRSYMLTFLAKGDYSSGKAATQFNSVRLDTTDFATLPELIDSDWALYKFNLDLPVSATKLSIEADGDFYIDNIRMTEIKGRYFLIKDSWNTPEICFTDIFGNYVGPTLNLGCEAYTDRANDVHYLHNFSEFCQESAVGCELVVDTKNYSDFGESIWNDINADGLCTIIDGQDCEYVEGDSLIFAVYNEKNSCNAGDKGCSLLGEVYSYPGEKLYKDTYLKNNPDHYSTILCNEEGSGCDEWKTNEGISYFHYPGDQVCEWREGSTVASSTWYWYKKKVKRCDDGNGIAEVNGIIDLNSGTPEENKICLENKDCGNTGFLCKDNKDCRMQACVSGLCSATGEICTSNEQCPILGSCNDGSCYYSCIQDRNDYECVLDVDSGVPGKTIGYGGLAEKAGQPTRALDGNWVGVCPIAESGCTEYVDPISNVSVNNVFNGDFAQDMDGDGLADGFSGGKQSILLEPATFYVLSVESDLGIKITLNTSTGNNDIIPFDEKINDFKLPAKTINVTNNPGKRNSVMFFTGETLRDPIILTTINISVINNTRIAIKKVMVDYSDRKEVDRTTCNGGVNLGNGCVLFNERKVAGGDAAGNILYDNLDYDADNSPNSSNGPELCPSGGCDSNVILSVSPDRQCNKWLACKSYVLDDSGNPECFNIGLCSKIDNNGFCENFITEGDGLPQVISGMSDIFRHQNSSGYVKVGMSGVGDEGMKGLYRFNDMLQEGSSTFVPNGGFEYLGDNKYPVGWVVKNSSGNNISWEDQPVRVVDNPEESQNEGIISNPEGKAFLKLGSVYVASSENIDVVSGTEYFLSGYLNTLKLSGGKAIIKVNGTVTNAEIFLDYGKGWTFKTLKFVPTGNMVSIDLYAEGPGGKDAVGNFYFDDIRIGPSLKTRTNKNIMKTCRLYPQTDSMTCEYVNDSGAREKGWYGYCLEYDRFPGSNDNCLVWWPVDRVSGEGIESDYGYQESMPLYYCQEAIANIPVERRKRRSPANKVVWGDCKQACKAATEKLYTCPPGYRVVVEVIDPGKCPSSGSLSGVPIIGQPGTPGEHSQCMPTCVADSASGGGIEYMMTDDGEYGWFDYYKGIMPSTQILIGGDTRNDTDVSITIPAEQGIKFYNKVTKSLTDNMADCLQLTQVVTPSGQNKYWSGRVYENSDYYVNGFGGASDLGYIYNTFNVPFGSMWPPEPLSNPYEWSSKSLRPVPVIMPYQKDKANAGHPYSITGGTSFFDSQLGICSKSRSLCVTTAASNSTYACKFGESCQTPFPNQTVTAAIENIKRLYAKNYGTWVWDETQDRYILKDAITLFTGQCTANPTIKCTVNECGALACTYDTTAKVCSGGSISGEFCTNDCAGGTACVAKDFIVPDYVCSNNVSRECCDSGVAIKIAACTDCRPTYDGSYRCVPSGVPCNPVVDGAGYMCNGGANHGAIVLNATCDAAASCDPTGKSTLYDFYACNVVGAPTTPLQLCCPGGSCVNDDIYTCGATSLADGGKRCFECQGNGTCNIISVPGAGTNSWGPPGTNGEPNNGLCFGGVRNIDDYCAITPVVKNILVNKQKTVLKLQNNFKFVNLTFNSDVDENQLPLVRYSVNWGDDTSTVVAGAKMADRPNPENPHSLYHLYDYWSMRNKLFPCPTAASVNCCFAKYCVVQPEVQIGDNWGWCNNGVTINDCSNWVKGPKIQVYE